MSNDHRKPTEAQCPECKTWHRVERKTDSDGDSGWWWAHPRADGSTGCPGCGALICVEAECEFRHAVYSGASPREFVRWEAVDRLADAPQSTEATR